MRGRNLIRPDRQFASVYGPASALVSQLVCFFNQSGGDFQPLDESLRRAAVQGVGGGGLMRTDYRN